MFGGSSGAGKLSEALKENEALKEKSAADGPVLTPAAQMGIIPPVSATLPLMPLAGDPIVSVLTVPMKLAKQLGVMREELVKTVNEGELKRKVEGFSFDHFEESAVAVRFIGVALFDRQFPEEDPRREPYTKICTDLCTSYGLPDDVRQNMLNGQLAREMHQLHYEFKFTKGKPGNFYFGKYMALNTGGKIDMVLLFYRLGFKISPDAIIHETAHKFLWWTTHTTYNTELREISLSEKDITDFKNFFRLKMYKELNDQIKAFEVTDE